MIISHNYKYIFINQPKTGGTSMRSVLSGTWHTSYRSAKSIEQFVGEDIWRYYYKFAIVRNPFSRMVSWYRNVWEQIKDREKKGKSLRLAYEKFKIDAPTFRDFIISAKVFDRGDCESFYFRMPQVDFLSDSQGLNINYIAHTETLSFDWQQLARNIKLDAVDFPHENMSTPTDYREWYDDELKEIMFKRFEKDFIMFNYTF